MQKVLKNITNIALWVSGICLLALTILIVIGIIFRYILHHSLPWTTELSQFLLMWMVYFGTSAVSLNREHITADILGMALNEKGKRIRDLISEIFNVSMIVMVLWKLVPYTIQLSNKRNASTVMRMPQYIMFITFGIGFALLAIVHLSNVIRIAQSLSSGNSQSGEETRK